MSMIPCVWGVAIHGIGPGPWATTVLLAGCVLATTEGRGDRCQRQRHSEALWFTATPNAH